MLIGKYNKSVILTYIGLLSSAIGIYFAFYEMLSYSMICLIISGICDLFDGKFARMCKRNDEEKEFGVQIDSLVDVISFLVLPCCIGLKILINIPKVLNIVFVFYMLAGIIRLAWFNMNSNKDEATKYYIGLPVTYSALIIPLVYAINLIYANLSIPYIYFSIYLVIGLAFILNIKIVKPKGIWYIIFAILAIAVITLIIMMG